MEQIFTVLTHAVEGTLVIALAAALAWGILSIVLSPCHLASIPLIVGFIDKPGRMTTRRAFTISLLFALGILITIGVLVLLGGCISSTRRGKGKVLMFMILFCR